MAGLTKRFCRVACSGEPPERKPEYKGLCGCCSDKYYNCDEDGNNCGEWQCEESEARPSCCSCAPNACGDGHNCPRYIDIEFDLNAFVIQGKTCCNGSSVPLTQQCAGAYQDEEPYIGTPSGWGAATNGVQDFVIYEKTEHKIRLTRQDCGCFWGGYWSSSCDCNTCCCTNHQGGDPDAGDCVAGVNIYPDCDDCYIRDCFPFGTCVQDEGLDCRACDPASPCYPTDDGYASSQDDHGTGNVGGSDGQALCSQQSGKSTEEGEGGNGCGYWSNDCDDWIDAGTPAYACWNCGTFKPHHIQAWLTYTEVVSGDDPPNGQCNVAWVLEIRGVTEDVAKEFGLSNSFPSFDCAGGGGTSDACAFSNGGYASDYLGYRGKWQGRHSVCNLACDQSGDTSPVPEFVQHSCGCPPTVDLETSINVTGATAAFHPSAVFGTGFNNSTPKMHPCVVNDAQGSQPSETWCQNAFYEAVDPVCTDKQQDGAGGLTKGTCYGPPLAWHDRCYYCDDCCNGDWSGGCSGSCECTPLDPWCSCAPPNSQISNEGIPDPLYPCSHCCGGVESLNHPTCNPCIAPPDCQESHICTPCRLTIRPNNSEVPAWRQ